MHAAENTDDRFFAALLDADAATLQELLAPDFTIIDVMAGSVVARDPFVAAIRDRIVAFDAIDVEGRAARSYGDDTAVIVGSTRMSGTFAGSRFAVHSRYTHVFVRQDGDLRLASAQGTQIADQ
jgi:ketosteroid isomerase-like protein